MLDAARAVQQRILAVNVQMDELAHLFAQFVAAARKTV